MTRAPNRAWSATAAFFLGALVALPESPAPRLALRPGEFYFRSEGRPSFVLGRNPAGMRPEQYAEHFRSAAAAGERFARIHFAHIPPGEKPGEIAPGMLQAWDAILDAAEQQHLAVLPVLGVWSYWNDGSNGEGWHTWEKNPFNALNGGPAKRPSELFENSLCRALWLRRLDTLVRRWSPRPAIVGWELFSELDLVTGSAEAQAVAFAEQAAAVIRAADPLGRPVTASQAGVCEWPALQRSPALDFIQIHPYANGRFGGRLDELILSTVRQRLSAYRKPVLIGESGLDAGPPHGTLDAAPRAKIGVGHAVWAALVSGAMNGRALWWQDGYDLFEKADLCSQYARVAETAAAFVRDVDFTGFKPVTCEASEGVVGAVVGSDVYRLGWFRDRRSVPPEWPEEPVAGQLVKVDAQEGAWRVEFVDPATGRSASVRRVQSQDGRAAVALPEFRGALAFRMTRLPPAAGGQSVLGPVPVLLKRN